MISASLCDTPWSEVAISPFGEFNFGRRGRVRKGNVNAKLFSSPSQCCRDWYPRWTRWPNWLMSDSAAALTVTFFVNAAILVLAAMVFFGKESVIMSGGQVVSFTASSDWIRVAYLTLSPLLGTAAASTLFAVALLASGQSSTITSTLAGQVVMEGFMHWRINRGCGGSPPAHWRSCWRSSLSVREVRAALPID